MKKLLFIFTLFFTLAIFNSNAQARLGYSSNEIRSEFSASKYKLTSGNLDDGQYYINITTNYSFVFYYFNQDYICNSTAIVPKNQKVLNALVENYNENYVKTSATSWDAYLDGGILKINLIYPDEGGYYFKWSY